MADTNLTSISSALKQVYGDYVAKQQNLSHRSLDEIAKSSKKYNAGGQGFYGAVNAYGNESIGAISEEESFRTIDSEIYAQYKVSPKVNVAPIQFSGLVAKAADSDEESFVSIVVDALEMAKERLLKDRNRQFFGLGTGLLGTPSTSVLSNVTSFTVSSAQYLRDNMIVDIFNGATKTVTGLRLTSVDKQANVVYFAASTGVALTSSMQIVKQNIRDTAPTDGKECMGLRGIVDDGTDLTTCQNIDASANRYWRSIRIDAASANLTSDLMQRLMDDVAILGGQEPDTFIMHRKQRRKYLDIVVPEKRYMDQKLDSGFQKLSFNGIDLFLDEDCQDDTLYCLSRKNIFKFEVAPLAMGGYDGSDQFLRAINQDLFQGYWRVYDNYGTDKRNAHGKIIGLAKPNGVS